MPALVQPRKALYLCINYWQTVCAHHVDMPSPFRHLYTYREAFDPRAVKHGDRVFVLTDLLDAFIKRALPLISHPFELGSGDSLLGPSEAAVARLHECPLVVRWYAVNSAVGTHKISGLPLGIRDPFDYDHGALGAATGPRPLDVLALCDYDGVPGAFDHPRLVRHHERCQYSDYIGLLAESKYVLCPRPGDGGPDLHAVYDALLVGAIPIYLADGAVPAAYSRLPVIVATDTAHLRRILDDLDSWAPWAARIDWQRVTALLRDPRAWLV